MSLFSSLVTMTADQVTGGSDRLCFSSFVLVFSSIILALGGAWFESLFSIFIFWKQFSFSKVLDLENMFVLLCYFLFSKYENIEKLVEAFQQTPYQQQKPFWTLTHNIVTTLHRAIEPPPLPVLNLATNNRIRTPRNLPKREQNLRRLGCGCDRWRCAAFWWWRLGRWSLHWWLWRTWWCGGFGLWCGVWRCGGGGRLMHWWWSLEVGGGGFGRWRLKEK